MWKKRRAYSYVNRYGTYVYVPEKYYWSVKESSIDGPTITTCPRCKASVEIIKGKNRGIGYFEPGLVRYGTRHSCFTQGKGMSQDEDAVLRDLLEEITG